MAAYLILTKADRLILDSYKTVLDGFSEYFGEGYELVLHSLEDLEHSVIKIINGHYTNREEGAPITDLALTMLERIRKQSSPHSLVYFNRKNGSTLKSATIPIIGEGELSAFYALICIWTFRFQPCYPHSLMNLRRRLQLRKALMRTWRD